jgi:hypothetical protein
MGLCYRRGPLYRDGKMSVEWRYYFGVPIGFRVSFTLVMEREGCLLPKSLKLLSRLDDTHLQGLFVVMIRLLVSKLILRTPL